ncbi:MAG: transposase [Proteobacteria bacterium]|nr:transposase [Pseudomonadota bacterium]
MTFNPDIHHRRSIRLKEYNYAEGGAYFVTICAFQRECLFGDVVDGEMQLNEIGMIAQDAWDDLPKHYSHVELDQFVIMPNHVHGIVVLNAAVEISPKRHGFPEIVRAFKSFSAKRVNQLRVNPGCPMWQRNYFERVIRNEDDLSKAREYIVNNPMKWELDKENPANVTDGG